MKKGWKVLVLILMMIGLSGCGNKYKGYWCSYDETATIVVLMERDNTEKQRKAVEEKISNFINVSSSNYYSREDYANELGGDVNDLDIYDTFVILFDSMDSIGTYIKELQEMKGVRSAEQSNAKTNMSLYNIKSWNKYSYTNSDEATAKDLEVGKYKMKKGVITFTPDGDGATRLLYIKDGLLCGDADCNKIYARSTETCSSPQEENK